MQTGRIGIALAAVVVALLASVLSAPGARSAEDPAIRVWRIEYPAHDGSWQPAYLALPAWYGPENNPPIPLVISPHGRGVFPRTNLGHFGDLPAVGGFAVVSPRGQGRRLSLHSWGYPAQIRDLAKMPRHVTEWLPWVQLDSRRIYAFGGSMGGQESLLIAAHYPRLLAGVAAFDAVADFEAQYWNFRFVHCDGPCTQGLREPVGPMLQKLARKEVGGTPGTAPRAYARRSPLTYADRLASAGVPIQLWWSREDRVVVRPEQQSEALYRRITDLNPAARIASFVGAWRHTGAMRADKLLPLALAEFGLLPPAYRGTPVGVEISCSPTWGR